MKWFLTSVYSVLHTKHGIFFSGCLSLAEACIGSDKMILDFFYSVLHTKYELFFSGYLSLALVCLHSGEAVLAFSLLGTSESSVWHLFFVVVSADEYINILINIRTDRSEQTVQSQIRLLLQEQSDQDLHCLPFHLHLLDALLH